MFLGSDERCVTTKGLCLVLGVVFAALTAGAGQACAQWTPTKKVGGPAIQQVIFDHHNVPWATFSLKEDRKGSEAGIARVADNGHFLDVRPIPAVSKQVETVSELALDPADDGQLLVELTGPGPGPPAGPRGFNIALAAWHPGTAIGRLVRLPPGLVERYGGVPRLAISPNGEALVLWSTGTEFVEVARARGKRLLGVQRIGLALAPEQHVYGEEMQIVELAPAVASSSPGAPSTSTEGFRAEWEVGPHLETAQIGPGGVFSAPFVSPFPLDYHQASSMASDARGDQALVWTVNTGGTNGDVYVSSRTAGGAFEAPQMLGPGTGATAAVSSAGEVTVTWESNGSRRIMADSGVVGRPLGAPSTVWVGKSDQTGTELKLVFTRNKAIDVWTVDTTTDHAEVERVQAAISLNGTRFSASRRLSITGPEIKGCWGPTVLVPDRRGGAFVGMSCTGSQNQHINEYTRYRPW
jgi:hypothetical protein